MNAFAELLRRKRISTQILVTKDCKISERYLELLIESLTFRKAIATNHGFLPTPAITCYTHHTYVEFVHDGPLSVKDVMTIAKQNEICTVLTHEHELFWGAVGNLTDVSSIEEELIIHMDSFYTILNLNCEGIYNVH